MYIIHDNISKYNNIFYNNLYYLSNSDKEKLNKLIKKDNKKRFILSRYLLYNSLKKYYNIDYKNIKINYNKHGKPLLDNIYFNISHSYNNTVLAISNNQIGIDIEKIRKVDLNIMNIFCTEKEKKYILNSKNKYKSLFQIFCLKEAYFKMYGTDLKKIKKIEFNIQKNEITCTNNKNINIYINNNLKNYIIAIIEKKN